MRNKKERQMKKLEKIYNDICWYYKEYMESCSSSYIEYRKEHINKNIACRKVKTSDIRYLMDNPDTDTYVWGEKYDAGGTYRRIPWEESNKSPWWKGLGNSNEYHRICRDRSEKLTELKESENKRVEEEYHSCRANLSKKFYKKFVKFFNLKLDITKEKIFFRHEIESHGAYESFRTGYVEPHADLEYCFKTDCEVFRSTTDSMGAIWREYFKGKTFADISEKSVKEMAIDSREK